MVPNREISRLLGFDSLAFHMTNNRTYYRLVPSEDQPGGYGVDVVDSDGKTLKQLRLPPGSRFEIPSYKEVRRAPVQKLVRIYPSQEFL
jgi:hypothetical protein